MKSLLLLSALLAQTPDAPPAAETDTAAIEAALAADAKQPPPPARSTPSLNPDLSFIADVGLGYFTSPNPLENGGHDLRQNGFALQQLELAVGQAVDPYFRFDANIVFRESSVEIEEVYATTLALPGRFQIRAGQFLTRFGRQNTQHLHRWDFLNLPFAVSRVLGPEGNRGIGLEVSWLSPLPWSVELVGSLTDAAGEETAVSFYGGDDLGVRTPLDFQATFALKQFFELSAHWGLAWGLSAATGPNSTGSQNRSDLYGTDLYLKFRPLGEGRFTVVSLQTEWFYRRRQIPGDVLRDLNGYAQLFWRFAQRWAVATRYEYGTPAYGLNHDIGIDPNDTDWVQERHRTSLALTFWPTEFSRLRLQGMSDLPRWRAKPEWAVLLGLEFSVGAHGAHLF